MLFVAMSTSGIKDSLVKRSSVVGSVSSLPPSGNHRFLLLLNKLHVNLQSLRTFTRTRSPAVLQEPVGDTLRGVGAGL